MVRLHQGIVKQVGKSKIEVINDVWFIHAGLTSKIKMKLSEASMSLNLNDFFWPMQGAAEGELLIGPFNSQEEADSNALKFSQLTNTSVWTVLLAGDAL